MTATRKRWALGCLRAFVIFVIVAVVLLVLLYAEEDWRGARELAAAKAKWQAAGYSLNPADYYPPPVPDDKNLAALPVFQMEPDPVNPKSILAKRLDDALAENTHGGYLIDLEQKKRELPELVAIAFKKMFPDRPMPSSSVAQLEALYPIIGELRTAAATRPEFRLNQDYGHQPQWERPLALVVAQFKVAKLLNNHAELALRENQPQVALDDVVISFRLARGVGEDPSLIGGLMSIGISTVTRRNLIEGLEKHAWNDAQLAQIQEALGRIDDLAMFQFCIKCEGVMSTVPLTELFKVQPELMRAVVSANWDETSSETALIPLMVFPVWANGWWDMNGAKMLAFEQRLIDSVDSKTRSVDSKLNEAIAQSIKETGRPSGGVAPWNVLYTIFAGPVANSAKKFSRGQVELDEDRIVCAMERYRLAHGAYPATLDALAPQFIDAVPHDVMSGQAYHYKVNADGTYLLYSVGWNGTDEGGKVVTYLPGSTGIDFSKGDWVWPMMKK